MSSDPNEQGGEPAPSTTEDGQDSATTGEQESATDEGTEDATSEEGKG